MAVHRQFGPGCANLEAHTPAVAPASQAASQRAERLAVARLRECVCAAGAWHQVRRWCVLFLGAGEPPHVALFAGRKERKGLLGREVFPFPFCRRAIFPFLFGGPNKLETKASARVVLQWQLVEHGGCRLRPARLRCQLAPPWGLALQGCTPRAEHRQRAQRFSPGLQSPRFAPRAAALPRPSRERLHASAAGTPVAGHTCRGSAPAAAGPERRRGGCAYVGSPAAPPLPWRQPPAAEAGVEPEAYATLRSLKGSVLKARPSQGGCFAPAAPCSRRRALKAL